MSDLQVLINTSQELSSLAEDINKEHQACITAMRSSLEHAVRAGELLTQAKAQVEHGAWLPWVAANCEFSERTAQAYMRVSARWPELEKAQRVADLSFRDALQLLAESKEPQDVRDYEIHELGLIFPMMGESELNSLADSVNQHGLYSPITLFEGKILDGKCRYEACRRAGVNPRFIVFPDDYPGYRGSALDFVLSANFRRQHFTESQKAVMVLSLERYTLDDLTGACDVLESLFQLHREMTSEPLKYPVAEVEAHFDSMHRQSWACLTMAETILENITDLPEAVRFEKLMFNLSNSMKEASIRTRRAYTRIVNELVNELQKTSDSADPITRAV